MDIINLPSSKWQPLFEEQQIQSIKDVQTFQGNFKIYSALAVKASDDNEKQCLAQIFKISKETLELAIFLDSNNLPSTKWQPLFEEQQIQSIGKLQTFQGDLNKYNALTAKASDDDEKQYLVQIFKLSKKTLELAIFLDNKNLSSSKWLSLFEEQQIQSVKQLQTFQGDVKKCIPLAVKASDDEKQYLAKIFKIAEATLVIAIDFMHFLEKLGHAKHFPQKLTLQDALLIRQIEPDYCQGTFDAHKLFYLMLEKIMMSNYECRKVFLFKHSADDDDDYEIAVHPMDSLFALIHCADDFLRQDLYSKLISCQLAVPLLLPDHVSDTIVFPLWAMYSIIKQWKYRVQKSETEFTFEAHDGRVVDCQVPLISFIRFNHPLNCSKSKILNSVISDLKHDFFFNYECEGSSVPRQFVDGLVEACWYFPSGEKSDIFNNAVTFANLRGNASKHIQQLDFLIAHSDMLFVFLNEDDVTFESTGKFSSVSICGNVIFILHSEKGKQHLKALVPNCEVLMLKKEPAAIVRLIRLKIMKRMSDSQIHCCQLSQTLTSCNELCIKVDTDSPYCKQGQILASNIMKTLKDIPAAEVKEVMVPLQGPNLWHKWANLDKKQNRMKWGDSGFKGLETFNSEMRARKEILRKGQLEKAKNLSCMVEMFLNVLLHEPMEVRSYFLQWLKFYFEDKLCGEKTAEHQLQSLLQKQAENLINASSFKSEHLFRELAQLYESTLFMESKDNEEILTRIKMLPKVAAELLLLGHPLEIFDGDAAHIPLEWITAVLEELKQLTNNSTLFILSVLGIQSTGKSTLLNTLFGVRLAVSAGRCTRGAYFQLLKLDATLSTEAKCDYVLVIDTEGLRAPELSDQDTQQHDNELATLVIGLASVTIINIFGEVPADIDDILQTTVHAFIRMKEVELNPSCQFVKHHVANVSASKTNEGRQQFLNKLDGMTVLAAKAEHCEGLYVHFSNVITFNDKTDVHNFPSLWEGNPPMAPVNPAYCEAAHKLKSKFITDLSKSLNFLCSIDHFKERILRLWNAILKENFIFSFKNTLEMEAYSCVDAEYSRRWSWELQKLVLEWESTTRNRIKASDNTKLQKIEQEQIDMIHQQMDDKYDEVMEQVKFFFEGSKPSLALIMAKWRFEYETKLLNVKNHQKNATEKFCKCTIQSKHAKSKIQHLKEDKRTCVAILVKDLVSQMDITKDLVSQMDISKDRKLTAEDHHYLKETFNSKWNEWMLKLYKEHPPPETQNISNEILNCLRRKCQLNAQDYLICSKAKEIPLEERGQKPFQLSIDAKNHLNLSAKFHILTEEAEDHDHILEKALTSAKQITACWLSEAESFLDKQNNCYNDLLVISLVQDLITKIDTYESMPEVTFKFTLDYRIDIILEVAGYSLRVFTKIQQDMIKDHPTTYMESLRPTYYTKFKTLCDQTAHEKAAAMCLTDLVVKHFAATLQSKLEIAIVTDLKQSNPIFYSKIALKGHILLRLLEEQKFELYITYLTNIKQSYLDWARLFVEEHCRMRTGKCIITELAEKELNQFVTRITNAAEGSLRTSSNIKQWLKHFHSKVSSTLPLNDRELDDMIDIQEDSDLKFLTEEFLKGIQQRKEEYLASFQTSQTCKVLDMSKWPKHPAETIQDTIAGCCERCPFCNEQCEETNSNHSSKHHCSLHRPQGLAGWRNIRSQVMTIEMCTELVGMDRKFKCSGSNDKFVKYKKYRTIFPDWFIPHEQNIIAPYWKWFIINYQREIAELFEYKVELPSTTTADWRSVTVADAREDIKKRYNL